MKTYQKRWTDINKWSNAWFRDLSMEAKVLYLYILDRCDRSGVWESDWVAAKFEIGDRCDWERVFESLSDRFEKLGDNTWFCKKFIQFQEGAQPLSPECNRHKGLFRLIKHWGLSDEQTGVKVKAAAKGGQSLKKRRGGY